MIDINSVRKVSSVGRKAFSIRLENDLCDFLKEENIDLNRLVNILVRDYYKEVRSSHKVDYNSIIKDAKKIKPPQIDEEVM